MQIRHITPAKMVFNKGFTIIELVVVIAIIAILSGIVMLNVGNYITKAKIAAAKANLKQMQNLAASYVAQNSSATDFCISTDAMAIASAIGTLGLMPAGQDGFYCFSYPTGYHWVTVEDHLHNDYTVLAYYVPPQHGLTISMPTICTSSQWKAVAFYSLDGVSHVWCVDANGYMGEQTSNMTDCFCH